MHELGVTVSSDSDDVLNSPDLIIFSTAHSKYKSDGFISDLMKLNECKIFDMVGLLFLMNKL